MTFARETNNHRFRLRAMIVVSGVAALLSNSTLGRSMEGDSNSDVALLLLALGIGALLLGLRNLRALSYKPLTPKFRRQLMRSACGEDSD